MSFSPLLKTWCFQPADVVSQECYYIADYIYHTGVGVDNPMRRVEKRYLPNSELELGNSVLINTDRVDKYLEQIQHVCEGI